MPNSKLIHVDRPLTDLVVAYDPLSDGFMHNVLFPRKSVAHRSDQIRTIDQASLLRVYDAASGSDSSAHEVDFKFGATLNYSCSALAFDAVLDRLDAKDADSEIQYEQRKTMQATTSMMQKLEHLAIKQTARSTSVLTVNTTVAAADRWDNFPSGTSDPITDLLALRSQLAIVTGKDPNHLSMSEFSWFALAQNPRTISHLSNDSIKVLTPAILEQMLRMPAGSIKISKKIYTSVAEGNTAAQPYKLFYGSDVIMAVVEDGGLNDFSLGHQFAFSGMGSDPVSVLRFEDPKRGAQGSNIVRVCSVVDFKVTNAKSAFLLKGVIDTAGADYNGYVD